MNEVLSSIELKWSETKLSSTTQNLIDITNFENKYSVSIPEDLRQYFISINGTGGEYDDD